MLGRLIIAVLIICSAAAVYWHRQKTEAADIGEAVAEGKAAEAEKRVSAAEKRAKEAEERAQEAEAKASFFEAELAKLSASADDPVNAEKALHVAGISYQGVHPGRHHVEVARFELALAGDPADITAVRVFPSDAIGMPVWRDALWDSQAKEHWPMDVLHGGVLVVDEHAPSVMHTRAGNTILVLELPLVGGSVVAHGMTFTAAVDADGKTTSKVITLERRDP